ncbi:helix-turn-helix domain-containing protein [Amycolatopsis sp. SB7-3]|uniref:helix-turn-helix domain-containing protein n=1 Tax=Amycolatopsis sp. SB7-3 TaxID=3373438 RepID=UPI003744860C
MALESTGVFIRQCRSRRNLTQRALAELCGMGQGTISRIETGSEPIRSVETLMTLARALECSHLSILVRLERDHTNNTGGWRAR